MALLLLVIFVALAWRRTGYLYGHDRLGDGPSIARRSSSMRFWRRRRAGRLIIVGNLVGFVFAAVAFTVGVISFPLLIDKNVSFVTAVKTSVRSVAVNPVVLAIWGL